MPRGNAHKYNIFLQFRQQYMGDKNTFFYEPSFRWLLNDYEVTAKEGNLARGTKSKYSQTPMKWAHKETHKK